MFSEKTKKCLMIVSALLMMISPFWASGYTGETPGALAVYNRAADWASDTHITGNNNHGSWAYYFLRNDNFLAYGRGDSSVWVNMPKHATAAEYQFTMPLPAQAAFAVKNDRLSAMWNKSTNDAPDLIYREGEALCVFTAPEDGSYNIVGDLKWSCELNTDPRVYAIIGTISKGTNIFNQLWISEMLRDADNVTPYTLIDPASPVDVPGFADNAALKDVGMLKGDKLVIVLKSGVTNYRRGNLHDSGLYIERFEMGPLATYNRAIDWSNDTHTLGANTHGRWSYHIIKKADITAYGRGDSAYWVNVGYRASDDYLLAYPLPAFWQSQIFNNRLFAYWNRDASNDNTYQECEQAMVFTVPDKGQYSIAGALKWSNYGATDTRGYVHIGTIKAGQSVYNNLWSSVMLRDADNLTPYEMIPEASPVDVPGFADNSLLQNIPLNAGDKIVITMATGVLNFRGIRLHDSELVIQQWPSSDVIDFNRGTDMGVSVKSGNSHGTKFDTASNVWQYWIKRQALDRLNYLPGELEAFNWNTAKGYFGEFGPGSFEAFADTSAFSSIWNRYPDTAVNYNPLGTEPWVVATFRNPYPATINYDITGATTWEKFNYTDSGTQGELFEISKINADFTTKTVLWSYAPPVSQLGVHDVPDPGLYGIDLAEGEYIAIAMRGCRLNYRKISWYNSPLTINADPDAFNDVAVSVEPAIVNSGVYPAPGTTKFVAGQEITISAQDFAGACPVAYTFDHWELNGQFYSDQPQASLVVDGAISLTAVFAAGNQCGDVCRPYPTGDVSMDCTVDLADFSVVAGAWLDCTDPSCD